jgi:hypothetical protein
VHVVGGRGKEVPYICSIVWLSFSSVVRDERKGRAGVLALALHYLVLMYKVASPLY